MSNGREEREDREEQEREEPRPRPSVAREVLPSWGLPAVRVLFGVLALALAARLADAHPGIARALARLGLDAEGARATLTLATAALASTVGMLMAWVLVAINMTARRYSLRVIRHFVSSRATTPILALFIGDVIAALATQVSVREDRVLPASVLCVAGLAALCLTLVLPYLFHLVRMLSPGYLVEALRASARTVMQRAAAGPDALCARRELIELVEQASDVSVSAVSATDIELSEAALHLMRDLLLDYQEVKERFPAAWFRVPRGEFLGRPAEELRDVEAKRIWFEVFTGLLLKTTFLTALNKLPDTCGGVAEVLQAAGEEAERRGDAAALELYVRLFNSILRQSINRRDVSAAYNVLNRYRQLAEGLVGTRPEMALSIGRHLDYYGREALAAGLDRIWVTAMYDLRLLASGAVAGGVQAEAFTALLARALEQALVIRPALAVEAAKSALIFLARAAAASIETVAAVRWVLGSLPRAAVEEAANQVVSVESATFWELTERGVNFDYVTPEERERVLAML